MEITILIVWSVGLVGALVVTLVILKQLSLVIGTLRDIHHLAVITRDAARGVAANVAATPELAPLKESVRQLSEAGSLQASVVIRNAQKLEKRSGGAE